MTDQDQELRDRLAVLYAEYEAWLNEPFTKKVTIFAHERDEIEKLRILSGTAEVQDQARRDHALFEGLANGLWYKLVYSHFAGKLSAEHQAEQQSVKDRAEAASGQSVVSRPARVKTLGL